MTCKPSPIFRIAIGHAFAGSVLAAAALGAAQVRAPTTSTADEQSQHSARDRDRHRDDDGIDAGTVIAGAVVIAGLAAILAGGSRDRERRDIYEDRIYRLRYGGARQAVENCVSVAEQRALRYGENANATAILGIERERRGYDILGEIKVDHRYPRSERNDRYGWSDRPYTDYGRFRCRTRDGAVRSIRVTGLKR